MRRCTWLLIFGGTVLCSFATGFFCGNSRVDQESLPADKQYAAPVNKQYATLKLLDEYRKTGDPEIRESIEQASGESEILAGRIFRAFRIFSSRHQRPEDNEFADNALSANTKLSLSVLRLLFSEQPERVPGCGILCVARVEWR